MEERRLRTHQLRVWLFEEEKQLLIKGAYELGLSQSDYLRNLIVYGGMVGRHWTMDKEQGKQILREINRIGNDINLIVYTALLKSAIDQSEVNALNQKYTELLTVIGMFPFLDKQAHEKWQQEIFKLLSLDSGI